MKAKDHSAKKIAADVCVIKGEKSFLENCGFGP